MKSFADRKFRKKGMPDNFPAQRLSAGATKGVGRLGNWKTPTPIVRIREIIKEIRFDARTERLPRVVLKRIVSCMESVNDGRVPGMIDYPLP